MVYRCSSARALRRRVVASASRATLAPLRRRPRETRYPPRGRLRAAARPSAPFAVGDEPRGSNNNFFVDFRGRWSARRLPASASTTIRPLPRATRRVAPRHGAHPRVAPLPRTRAALAVLPVRWRRRLAARAAVHRARARDRRVRGS
eukprot:30491-Pelagococcus_subviridis.AAC.3